MHVFHISSITLMMSKIQNMALKRDIYVNLPFCGDHSQKLGRQLKRLYSKIAPWTKLILIFKPIQNLNILSNLKSPYNLLSHSSVLYKVSCLDCTECYIGMTQRILQIRLKNTKKSSTSAIYTHIHETKHNINFTCPDILANDQVKLRLQIKETLHIKAHKRTYSIQIPKPKHRVSPP